jgi:hypothetical protein
MKLEEEARKAAQRKVRKVKSHEAAGGQPYEPYVYMISIIGTSIFAVCSPLF